MTTLSLTHAIELFEPHLDDIADALAENVTAALEALQPWPESNWVTEAVRELEVEAITAIPLKTIRRIQSRKYYQQVEATQGTNYERITDDDIIRAKEVPIEDLYDGQLNRKGVRLWGICPFHTEETGSFCIHDDNRWSCFGQCNEHGDSIDFVIKDKGLTGNDKFIKAVKSLIR